MAWLLVCITSIETGQTQTNTIQNDSWMLNSVNQFNMISHGFHSVQETENALDTNLPCWKLVSFWQRWFNLINSHCWMMNQWIQLRQDRESLPDLPKTLKSKLQRESNKLQCLEFGVLCMLQAEQFEASFHPNLENINSGLLIFDWYTDIGGNVIRYRVTSTVHASRSMPHNKLSFNTKKHCKPW